MLICKIKMTHFGPSNFPKENRVGGTFSQMRSYSHNSQIIKKGREGLEFRSVVVHVLSCMRPQVQSLAPKEKRQSVSL